MTPVYTPRMRSNLSWRLLALAAVLAISASACAPPVTARAATPVLDVPTQAEPYPYSAFADVAVSNDGCRLEGVESADGGGWTPDLDLRGDPGFDPAALPGDVLCWYEELWRVITDEARAEYFTGRADRNDLYVYAREVHNHLAALLTAFRLTGDLELLDEVDRLAQHMRANLDDAWAGRYRNEPGSRDGYLNWVWDRDSSDTHRGRDINEIDELRTHSGLAQVAYAFAANADLESPNGVPYAERAEFWLTYLQDHFEPKWRERNDAPWPEFPFIERTSLHGNTDFVRYHHYMHLLTGREEYAAEVRRLSDLAFTAYTEVETDAGPAYVATRGILAIGGSLDRLIPSTYFRHVVASVVDLHFEGVEPWSDDEFMTMLARSVAEFILDDQGDGFGRDIGGGLERAGIEPSTEFARVSTAVYNGSPFSFLAAWDATGKVADTTLRVHVHRGQREWNVFAPTALLMHAALASDPD